MRKKIPFSLLLFLGLTALLVAQPPKPPEGKRWMYNEELSDEFNGTELDQDKWHDHHPYWVGRPPAIFLPSQVSLKDGYLQIKNRKLDSDTVVTFWNGSTATYSIAGGAIVSKNISAHYGYYECSMKASKIRMSSTFWMASRGFPGPDPCSQDRYSEELDIQEAVGGASGGQQSFRNSMHSNTHYKYTDCSGNTQTYSAGNQIDAGVEVSDTFLVYAAHWKNVNTVNFYLNGEMGGTVNMRTDVDDTPFEEPMHINMVTETYDWVTPPSDEDLADDTRNTTYYDWVRSYKLVPVDYVQVEDPLLENGGFETGDFSHWTGWQGYPREVVSDHVYSGDYAVHIKGPGAPEYVVNLRKHATYTLSCYGKIVEGSGPILFGIKDPQENVLGSVQVTETSYTRKEFQFTTGSSGIGLKFYYYAPDGNAEGYADDFELTLNDPGDTLVAPEIPIYMENILLEETAGVMPAATRLEFLVGYQANGDRQLKLKLFNADSILMGENIYPALAGYGSKRVELLLDSVPSAGRDYRVVAELWRTDSAQSHPVDTYEVVVELQNPVDITVRVLDVRNDFPLAGADITLNGATLQSSGDGTALFPGVPPGMIQLEIESEGFDRLTHEGEIATDTTLEIRMVPLTRHVTIEILDGYTGDPVDDVSLTLGELTKTSDHNGEAQFATYSGTYQLTALAAYYHPDAWEISISEDSRLTYQLWRSRADLKFVVKNEGNYLHNATISLEGINLVTSTVGVAFFEGLKTDTTYSYTVQHEDINSLEDSLILHTDTTLRISLGTATITDQNRDPEEIRFFPNPTTGVIQFSGLREKTEFRIRNLLGVTVREGYLTDNSSLDLSDLKEGVYFIQLGELPVRKLLME